MDLPTILHYVYSVDAKQRIAALRKLVRERAAAFAAVSDTTDCVRLCTGRGDGLPGLLVDRFGPLVVATEYAEGAEQIAADELLRVIRDCCPGLRAIAKVRASLDGKNRFVVASHLTGVTPMVASEQGLRFEIGSDAEHDFGLFPDAAKARAYVRGRAAGKRVLNLFSYTGAFGIAAAAGGAVDVANVDPNKDYLAWSLRNAALNGVAMRVLPDTAQDFLAKHLRRMARDPGRPSFDLVIVDPPAFGVGRGKQRVLRLLWPELFASLRTMAPAEVVLMCNDKAFRSSRSFGDLVQAELGSDYRFRRLGTILTPADLQSERPPLDWKETVEDPLYAEPTVLTGVRVDMQRSGKKTHG
jgi:23S rRNA (cytosine1962-C5)-methyltransferase